MLSSLALPACSIYPEGVVAGMKRLTGEHLSDVFSESSLRLPCPDLPTNHRVHKRREEGGPARQPRNVPPTTNDATVVSVPL